MAFNFTDAAAGFQAITEVSTVQKHALGTRAVAYDVNQGECEFVYVKGLASTAVGEGVSYDSGNGTIVRVVAATRGPVGVAMSALVANTYGWIQVFGKAVVKTNTVVAGGQVYATAVAGTLDDAVLATALWLGASFKSADGTPAAGFAYAEIAYPSMVGLG